MASDLTGLGASRARGEKIGGNAAISDTLAGSLNVLLNYCPDRGNSLVRQQKLMNVLVKIAILGAMLGMVSCDPLLTSEFISGEGLMYEGYEGTTSGYAPSTSYNTGYDTASYDSINTQYYSNSAPVGWETPPTPDLRHARQRHPHPNHAHSRHAAPPRHAHHPSLRGIHPPKARKGSKEPRFRNPGHNALKSPRGAAKHGNSPLGPEALNRGEKPAKEHKNH